MKRKEMAHIFTLLMTPDLHRCVRPDFLPHINRLKAKLYADLSTPKAMRWLVSLEAAEEVKAADAHALHKAEQAKQSIGLLSSRERKTAIVWILGHAAQGKQWGEIRHR